MARRPRFPEQYLELHALLLAKPNHRIEIGPLNSLEFHRARNSWYRFVRAVINFPDIAITSKAGQVVMRVIIHDKDPKMRMKSLSGVYYIAWSLAIDDDPLAAAITQESEKLLALPKTFQLKSNFESPQEEDIFPFNLKD